MGSAFGRPGIPSRGIGLSATDLGHASLARLAGVGLEALDAENFLVKRRGAQSGLYSAVERIFDRNSRRRGCRASWQGRHFQDQGVIPSFFEIAGEDEYGSGRAGVRSR